MLSPRLLVVGLASIMGGCSGPSTAVHAPGNPSAPTPAQDAAHLVLPATAATEPALGRLARAADAGDREAAIVRTLYLIDLFDDARFGANSASLELLERGLGVIGPNETAKRGAIVTDRVIEALIIDVDGLLAGDRLDPDAQAARIVLEFDQRPPIRGQLFQRITELKGIARGDSALAANARLRLAGFCDTAFADALRAPPRHAMRVLSHCLFPLYDADASPYLAIDPDKRPPPPAWQTLAEGLGALYEQVSRSSHRTARAAAHRKSQFELWLAQNGKELPSAIDGKGLGLPTVETAASPYDFTPIAELGNGTLAESTLDKTLAAQIQGDGRGSLAVALDETSNGAAVRRAAHLAVEKGAATVQLLVRTVQRTVVPATDYWASGGGSSERRFERVAVLDVSVVPLGRVGRTAPSADIARGSTWDASQARLGLHLVVRGDSWLLIAPDGPVATISGAAGDKAAELGKHLMRVRSAFPDENGLFIVPTDEATYSDVARAVAEALRPGHFTQVAFADSAPKTAVKTLAKRIARRANAKVDVVPDTLAERSPLIRRCYQALLEGQPNLRQDFELELRGGAVYVTKGPKRGKPWNCVVKALSKAMISAQVDRATVALSPN